MNHTMCKYALIIAAIDICGNRQVKKNHIFWAIKQFWAKTLEREVYTRTNFVLLRSVHGRMRWPRRYNGKKCFYLPKFTYTLPIALRKKRQWKKMCVFCWNHTIYFSSCDIDTKRCSYAKKCITRKEKSNRKIRIQRNQKQL